MGLTAAFRTAQFFLSHLTGAEQVLALGAELDAAEGVGVDLVLVRRVRVEADLLCLQDATGRLHAAREASEQTLKTFSLFSLYFCDMNHLKQSVSHARTSVKAR
jgi:hypothetical protein